jgi:superfamily I DNA/RNA helicase
LLSSALRSAGLRIFPRRPNDPLLSGAHAVLDTEARAVWIRADAPPTDRRVFVAHELAHLHLHENGSLCHCQECDFADPEAILAVGYGPRQRRETEANVFAREFLLPITTARRLFEGGEDARGVGARLGLPLPLVFAQLEEVLANPADYSPAVSIPATPWTRPEKSTLALDPSQEAAARAEKGPLLVGAGPGTGKTRTLTARTLFLTRERGIAPENLLALTFSRKAAEEMRERIAAQDAETARRASISTFHAYGLDLLRRHGKAIGLPPAPILLDPVDAFSMLERRAARLGLNVLRYLHDPAFPIPDILRAISRAKEDLITPDEYRKRAEAAGEERLVEVAGVYAAYEDLLREKGAIDYSDLVCRALYLLRESESVRASEQAQWRHILVDEYQDINRAGAMMVQALAGDGSGLWCVGDLRQAIYQFRGASPANVTSFQEDFPGSRRLDLAVNYRSRPRLVALFGAVTGEGTKTWQPSREETEATLTLGVAEDDAAQADGIARKMREFIAAGYRYADQVALCRTRGQARALRSALMARGIPVAPGVDESGLLSRRDVKDMVTLLARACEPHGPARRRFPELPEGLPYRGDAVEFFSELLWGRPAWARRITEPTSVGRLLSLARSFRDRSAALLEPGEDPRRAFLRHLRRMARMGQSLGEPEGEELDAVRLMTVHGAKGLEFPIVYIPNLSAGKFPSRPGPSLLPSMPQDESSPDTPPVNGNGAIQDEESRLFFVALTRARDHLILSRATRYGRQSAAASPLLGHLDGSREIQREVWRKDRQGLGESGEDDSSSPNPQSLISNLSAPVPATEAELYLRCPRRYYYERVAVVPSGERTAYGAFRRTVEEALASPDPVAGLEAAWAEHGLDNGHPHASLYREAASEIVHRVAQKAAQTAMPTAPRPRRPTKPEAPAPLLTIELPSGVISVQPDVAEKGGLVWEHQTFRKPPNGDEEEVPTEPRLSLLQEAAFRTNPDSPPSVQIRFLQTDEAYPVKNQPRIRARHLAAYDRALKGIQLKVYTPDPEDTADCPNCPYFFVCPDELLPEPDEGAE